MIGAKVHGGEKAKALLEAMRNRVSKGSGSSVRIGVPNDATEADGESTMAVAIVHEFGEPSQGIPPRPFLAPAIVDAKPDISNLTRNQLKGVATGKATVFVALERIGALAAGKVQQYIRNGNFAALKPETIKRKGSSKPLIDTGHMIQSVTYEVHEK